MRTVWLLALNCFAVCLLPLPGSGYRARSTATAPAVTPTGTANEPPPGAPVGAAAGVAELPAHGACGATEDGHWAGRAWALASESAFLAQNDAIRAEHFCAVYGCMELDPDWMFGWEAFLAGRR